VNILSAITAMGSMTFKDYKQIVKNSCPNKSEFFATKLRRDLTALGHIQIDFNRRHIQACSPRLCLLPGQGTEVRRAVLAGARNEAILKKFIDRALPSCFRVQQQTMNQFVPDRLQVEGRHQDLRTLSKQIDAPSFSIGDNPDTPDAWVLLHGVASLADRLKQHFARKEPAGAGNGADHWEVFQPGNPRFQPWQQVKEDYCWNLILIRKSPYLHWLARRREDGSWEYWQDGFEGDPLWAKWAVAQSYETQIYLPGPDSLSFSIPAWLPFPVELHRVCCLCTGMLPDEKENRISYHGIPAVIQKVVQKKLLLSNN